MAAVSTVRALFGAGGGAELSNAAVLAGLVEDHGAEKGRAVYDDFRNRDNPDGPVHTTRAFPYLQRDASRIDPRSTAVGGVGRRRSAAARTRSRGSRPSG